MATDLRAFALFDQRRRPPQVAWRFPQLQPLKSACPPKLLRTVLKLWRAKLVTSVNLRVVMSGTDRIALPCRLQEHDRRGCRARRKADIPDRFVTAPSEGLAAALSTEGDQRAMTPHPGRAVVLKRAATGRAARTEQASPPTGERRVVTARRCHFVMTLAAGGPRIARTAGNWRRRRADCWERDGLHQVLEQ